MTIIDVQSVVSAAERLSLSAKIIDLGGAGYWPGGTPAPVCLIASEPDRAARVIDSVEMRLHEQLHNEAATWRTSLDSISARDGSRADFRTGPPQRTRTQPWLIVDVAEGGLGALSRRVSEDGGVLVPCSAVQHHGVVRLWNGKSYVCVLATGRAPGQEWDPPSDFGHEGAHATLGQVPLFSQRLQEVGGAGFEAAVRNRTTDGDVVGMLCYIAAEIIVWFVRNESEATETGLRSLKSTGDLAAFLRVGSELGCGSGNLLAGDITGRFEQHQTRARELAAISWKIQRGTRLILDREEPPTPSEWRDLVSGMAGLRL